VRSQTELDATSSLVATEGRLKCPGFDSESRSCKAFYSAAAIARVVSDRAFDAWEAAKKRATEKKISEQVHEGHQAELRRLEEQVSARLTTAAAREERVRKSREHIVDRLLTLRCPNSACEAAFVDFDGCAALKCSSCRTAFCAYCLENCGADAHYHVWACRKSHIGQSGHWVTKREFESCQRKRRQRLVGEYLKGIADADERAEVLRSVEKDLKDIGIDPETVLDADKGKRRRRDKAAAEGGPAVGTKGKLPLAVGSAGDEAGRPHKRPRNRKRGRDVGDGLDDMMQGIDRGFQTLSENFARFQAEFEIGLGALGHSAGPWSRAAPLDPPQDEALMQPQGRSHGGVPKGGTAREIPTRKRTAESWHRCRSLAGPRRCASRWLLMCGEGCGVGREPLPTTAPKAQRRSGAKGCGTAPARRQFAPRRARRRARGGRRRPWRLGAPPRPRPRRPRRGPSSYRQRRIGISGSVLAASAAPARWWFV